MLRINLQVSSDYEGYMGNSGPSKEERYERYALAFYPASAEFDLLISKVGAGAAFKSLKNDMPHSADDVKLLDQFSRALNVWTPAIIDTNYRLTVNRQKGNASQTISDAVSIACRLNNIDLAYRVLDKLVGVCSKLDLLFPLVEKYGWVNLVDRLLPLIQGMERRLEGCITVFERNWEV
jgi:hypothetical protein